MRDDGGVGGCERDAIGGDARLVSQQRARLDDAP